MEEPLDEVLFTNVDLKELAEQLHKSFGKFSDPGRFILEAIEESLDAVFVFKGAGQTHRSHARSQSWKSGVSCST